MPDTELTPIRIRGKKARAASTADGRALVNATPGGNSSTSADASTSATAQQATSKRRRVGSLAANNPKADFVSFEKRLPLEVVEAIYLLSENINLSLCNKKLYWMLSRRQTRVEMALRAFQDVWDLYWTARLPKRLGVARSYVTEWHPCDVRFQTALLSCPWVDAPLLLDAEAIWMRRTFLRRGRGRNRGREWVRAVPWKEHVAFRRTSAPMDVWTKALQIDAAQALAVERAHDAFGCIDNRAHCWRTPLPGDEEREPHTNSWFSNSPPRAPWWRDIKKEAVPKRLPSTHVCFAYETLNMTINLTYWQMIVPTGPTKDAEDAGFEKEDITEPLEPCNGTHPSMHHKARIPERLLLAEGAPADLADDAVLDEETLEQCRAKLQRTYQLLLWIVLGGGKLQPADSWEVTLEGHRRLLALSAADGRAQRAKKEREKAEKAEKAEKEAAQAAKTEVEGTKDADASEEEASGAPRADADADAVAPATTPPTDVTATDATNPLRLPIQTLTVAMMSLFMALGVYMDQWPLKVLERELKAEARKQQALGKAYVHTLTSNYLLTMGNHAIFNRGEWDEDKHNYLIGGSLAALDDADADSEEEEYVCYNEAGEVISAEAGAELVRTLTARYGF